MGKTQQRVAGNVKPTSSGRIRDLLMNKQQGVSNIITFSALSSNPNTEFSSTTIVDEENKADITDSTTAQVDTNIVNESTPQTVASPVVEGTCGSNLENQPGLIVKRVGNRDYYMRVKPSKDSTSKPAQRKVFPFPGEGNVKISDKSLITDEETLSNKPIEGIDVNVKDDSEPPKVVQEEHDFENILDQIAQYRSLNLPLKVKSLDDVDDDRLGREESFIILLDVLVVNFKEELSIEEWDLVNSSVTLWIELVLNSNQLCTSPIRTSFCVKVFNFLHKLILLSKTLKDDENIKEEHPMLQSVLDDWDNFHSSKPYHDLITLYFKLVSRSDQLTPEELQIIKSFTGIVVDVDPKIVITNTTVLNYLKSKLGVDSDLEMPVDTRYCDIKDVGLGKGFSAICNLLRSNYRIITVTGHTMLSKIMSSICEGVTIASDGLDQVDVEKFLLGPPEPLMSLLISRDSMMSALLSDYRVGDISVTIEPNTDSYTCTLAYLFTWDLVVQFIVGLDKENGHRMIHCLKKLGLIQRLLDNAFMLVPPLNERNSLTFKLETDEISQHETDYSWSLSEFLKSPFRASVKKPINEIELTALHVYFSVALHMPVTVRKWYNNNSNKRLCNLVNEYTVKHISKVICSLEMESVQQKCNERADEDKMNNLVIKARPNAREVYAVYTRDEFRMELTIILPINYPLGPVQIDGGKRVGVTDLKWRGWLLRLTTFLAHQNGPILDGVDLWRKNIDKRFEGIEKCMICFSILHSNYQLPKKKCQTCSKMFHNLCLYKWFESSGNSTCPLCRNIW